MQRVLMIIAQKDFRDEELFDTKSVLEEKGIEVEVAAPIKSLAKGKLGGTVKPDLGFADIKASRYDAVAFIGGPGAFDFIENPQLQALARNFASESKLVAAICCAPALLATAGLLKGKQATVAVSFENYLTTGGANLSDENVIRDGKIITANGPAAASRFGQEMADYLLSSS